MEEHILTNSPTSYNIPSPDLTLHDTATGIQTIPIDDEQIDQKLHTKNNTPTHSPNSLDAQLQGTNTSFNSVDQSIPDSSSSTKPTEKSNIDKLTVDKSEKIIAWAKSKKRLKRELKVESESNDHFLESLLEFEQLPYITSANKVKEETLLAKETDQHSQDVKTNTTDFQNYSESNKNENVSLQSPINKLNNSKIKKFVDNNAFHNGVDSVLPFNTKDILSHAELTLDSPSSSSYETSSRSVSVSSDVGASYRVSEPRPLPQNFNHWEEDEQLKFLSILNAKLERKKEDLENYISLFEEKNLTLKKELDIVNERYKKKKKLSKSIPQFVVQLENLPPRIDLSEIVEFFKKHGLTITLTDIHYSDSNSTYNIHFLSPTLAKKAVDSAHRQRLHRCVVEATYVPPHYIPPDFVDPYVEDHPEEVATHTDDPNEHTGDTNGVDNNAGDASKSTKKTKKKKEIKDEDKLTINESYDSFEAQQRYGLERHKKGWCQPCKHYFATNSVCKSAQKGENCLYCHHEDHRADMPTTIDLAKASTNIKIIDHDEIKKDDNDPDPTTNLSTGPPRILPPPSILRPTKQPPPYMPTNNFNSISPFFMGMPDDEEIHNTFPTQTASPPLHLLDLGPSQQPPPPPTNPPSNKPLPPKPQILYAKPKERANFPANTPPPPPPPHQLHTNDSNNNVPSPSIKTLQSPYNSSPIKIYTPSHSAKPLTHSIKSNTSDSPTLNASQPKHSPHLTTSPILSSTAQPLNPPPLHTTNSSHTSSTSHTPSSSHSTSQTLSTNTSQTASQTPSTSHTLPPPSPQTTPHPINLHKNNKVPTPSNPSSRQTPTSSFYFSKPPVNGFENKTQETNHPLPLKPSPSSHNTPPPPPPFTPINYTHLNRRRPLMHRDHLRIKEIPPFRSEMDFPVPDLYPPPPPSGGFFGGGNRPSPPPRGKLGLLPHTHNSLYRPPLSRSHLHSFYP